MDEIKTNKKDEKKFIYLYKEGKRLDYKRVDGAKLKMILENHKKWIDTNGKEGKQADLKQADLQESKLDNAILINANLEESLLINAKMNRANFQGAKLSYSNWQSAMAKEVDLENADLFHANLQNANMVGANLKSANLHESYMKDINLLGAILTNTNFYGVNLEYSFLEDVKIDKANFHISNLNGSCLANATGTETDFSEANLEDTNAGGCKLLQSNFSNANLKKVNFKQSQLKGSNLKESVLENADLSNADLREVSLDDVKGLSTANLKYANLEGATGLLGNEFAQADVTGTKLPDGIKEFKALDIVEKTSENARKIFFAMLLGCVYSWLTIATTTDVRLITNTASSPLPIIGTEIPIAWFYIAAPLVLICLYFYFHLYLIKLWEALSGLPAKFPDGKRLDEIAYPWILNGLVRRYFELLKINRPFIAHVQEWLSIFLAWWVVPITIMAFWLRFIPKHDWLGTSFHIALIVFSVGFAIVFYRLCVLTLKGENAAVVVKKGVHYEKRHLIATGILLVGWFFIFLSYGAIEGVRLKGNQKIKNIQEGVPWALKCLGFDVFANFNKRSVSERSPNYWLIAKEERIISVKGANLKEKNLKNSNLSFAFLVNSEFINSNLNGSIFAGANLQKSNFSGAKLFKADFAYSNLREAIFQTNNLQQANLLMTDLQNAFLINTQLQGADLSFANLQNATIRGTNLENTDLNSTNLKGATIESSSLTGTKNLNFDQLCESKSLWHTELDLDLRIEVKQNCPQILEKSVSKK